MATVLIVDSDESIRETLRMVLEEAGYVVEEAPNGHDALARLQYHATKASWC